MRQRKVTTQLDHRMKPPAHIELAGWYGTNMAYLWFGIDDVCCATLEGAKLYRLCKAIVKGFERSRGKK